MKCQNCGINFDDEERECPICGFRTGKKGRLSAIPTYSSTRKSSNTQPNPQPAARKATYNQSSGSARLNGEQQKKTFSLTPAKIVVALILISVIFNIGTAIVSFIPRLGYAWNYHTSAVPEPDVQTLPEDEYTPQEDYSTSGFIDYPMLKGNWTTIAPSGDTLSLSVDEQDEYTLTLGDYQETGTLWLWYNNPEDAYYREAYPPERYDSYTFCLSGYEIPQPSEAFQARQQQIHDMPGDADIWMLLYYDRKEEQYIIDPYEEDTFDLFSPDPTPLLENITS